MIRILFRSIGKPLRMLPTKILQNKELKIKTPRLEIPVHNYIEFKHYTGNEIIYTLKDHKKLRPGEISSALLELGLRKGLPADFDWNSHPCMQELVQHLIQYIPRFTCRVLTSLAHGLNRLKISDKVLWQLLSVHILRTITTIEPIGLAYCFSSFTNKNFSEFYASLLEVLPVHLQLMGAKEFINVIVGISTEKMETDLYLKEFYPYLQKRAEEFSVSQLYQLIGILGARMDFDEGLKETLKAAVEKKLSTKRTVSFGAKGGPAHK